MLTSLLTEEHKFSVVLLLALRTAGLRDGQGVESAVVYQ